MSIIRFPTFEQIIAIHFDQIENYGGSHGVRDITLLESAVFRPQSSFGGNELYPTLFDKAAALCHSLIKNHPFMDGNKRTGMFSAIFFLDINGYGLFVSQKELVKTALNIAGNKLTMEQIADWLKKNSKKL